MLPFFVLISINFIISGDKEIERRRSPKTKTKIQYHRWQDIGQFLGYKNHHHHLYHVGIFYGIVKWRYGNGEYLGGYFNPFLIILTGIIFDIIGMAVTTAAESPFHSMAAHRIKGSARAIKLIKSKDKVSNFCNDVVGDICGIISGSASATVVAYIIKNTPTLNGFLMSIAITSFVAALTVGGKAIGKGFAIRYSNSIVYTVARFLSILSLRSK